MKTKNTSLLLSIPVIEIKESSTNPRSNFDEGLINDLAASIREKGLLSPIMVRPYSPPSKEGANSPDGTSPSPKGHGRGEAYEVVAGARRFRACQLIGIKIIPCLVRNLTDEEAFEIQIIENLQRSDVHPMDEATAFKKMLDNVVHKYAIEDIALKVGKNKAYITQRLKLNDLNDEYQKMFYAGTIQIGHAMELCRLQPDDQKACYRTLVYDTSSTTALRNFIKQSILLKLSEAAFPTDDPTLYAAAGACITCHKRSGFNQDLFGDIPEADRCFDGACFTKKKDLYFDRVLTDLSVKGLDKAFITDSYGVWPESNKTKYPGILKKGEFATIDGDLCKYAIKGVYTDGTNLGNVVDICPNKDCEEHFPKRLGFSFPNSNPKSRAIEELQELREICARNVRAALVKKIKTVPGYNSIASFPLSTIEETCLVAALLESDYSLFEKVSENEINFTIEDSASYSALSGFSPGEQNFIIRKFILNNLVDQYSDTSKQALDALLGSFELGQEEIRATFQAEYEAEEKEIKDAFIAEHGFDPEDETEKIVSPVRDQGAALSPSPFGDGVEGEATNQVKSTKSKKAK